jgi:hypothetical protein
MGKYHILTRTSILAGALGILLSIVLTIVQHETAPTPVSVHATQIRCTDERVNDFSCYKGRMESVTSSLGAQVALADLKRLYENNPLVRSQCHQLAHAIGNTVAQNTPDIADAFVNGDSICWSGYYHGVVEKYVERRGQEGFQKNADNLCAKVPSKNVYGFDYYNCVHGVGHGVMAITKNHLFDALALCKNLSGNWEKESCYGGVFMENIMSDNRNHYATYLKPDDLLYPCNAVDSEYKEECYKMQTSYALTKNGQDFGKLFELCASAEEGYQRTCAQSIGRDASGQSISNKERTIAWCALAKNPTQESDCYVGAVKDYVSYFHSDVQARALCFAILPQYQEHCESALLMQWHTLLPSVDS